MMSRPLVTPVKRELHFNQLANWLQLLEQKASYAMTLVTQNMAQGPAAADNTRVLSKTHSQALLHTDQEASALYRTLGLRVHTLTGTGTPGRHGPGSSSTGTTWELLKKANFWVSPTTPGSGMSGSEAQGGVPCLGKFSS